MGTQLGAVPAGTAPCPQEPHPAAAVTITGLSCPAVPQAQIQLFPLPDVHGPSGLSHRDPGALPPRCAPHCPPPAVPIAIPGLSHPDVPPSPPSICSHWHPRATHPAVAPRPAVLTVTRGSPIQMCSQEPSLSQSSSSPSFPSPWPLPSQPSPHPSLSPCPPQHPPPNLPPSWGYF